MSEEKKPFTVSDRRHFTSEGEVRKPGADEPTESRPEPDRAPAAAPAPSPSMPPPPPDAAREAGAAHQEGLAQVARAQASILLLGSPEGDAPDLESAHALIELLGALRDKTEGHRTPEEEQLLEGLLYELRMGYVQATKVAGR